MINSNSGLLSQDTILEKSRADSDDQLCQCSYNGISLIP